MPQLNENFLFNCVRKYNRAQRQTQRDAILHAAAVHAQLPNVEKKRSPLPTLSAGERQATVDFLNQFLSDQGVEVRIKS